MKRRHVFTNCRSSFICKKCFGKHRISLCSRNQITQQDETVTAHSRIFNDFLLQIAQAKISNVKGKDFLTISLLFDSGSQRTYNTDNLRKLLHLETVGTENIVINTFGNTNDSHTETTDVVQFRIKHRDKVRFVFIETIVFLVICSPLKKKEKEFVKNNYQHLYHLKLANRNEASSECVVGTDFYHSFFPGKTIRKQ